jgi:uncharacterized protein (DUF58 family)
VALVAAGFPVALLPALVHPRLWPAWLGLLVLTALLLLLDGLLLLPARRLSATAHVPGTLAIGEEGKGTLSLAAGPAGAGLDLLVRCELSPDLEPVPERRLVLGPGGAAELEFPLRPRRRGTLPVEEAWLRWSGPLHLLEGWKRIPLGQAGAVAPNVRAARDAALRFFGPRQFQSGLQVEKYLGDGSEFESLREWVPGHDSRAISWKASARHRRLLVQEFRAERNHHVVLALDTGRLMGQPLDGVPRLDHAVGAALLLSWVSLRLGDRVGLFGFDERVRAYAAPQGGLHAFPRLQQLSAGLAASPGETNFTLGLSELSARLRRRSLVVVMTEFVDTVTAELMIENLTRLARRQLVVFVALRDQALRDQALARPDRLSDVFRSAVATDLTRERERVLLRLRRLGIRCVDAPPGAAAAELVSRYLDIKRRELV